MHSLAMLTMLSATLVFSLALALLIEELVFGGLFRWFFGERPPLGAPAAAKPKPDLVARARDSGL